MTKLYLSLGDKVLIAAFFLAYFSGVFKLLGGSIPLLLVDFLLFFVLFLKMPVVWKRINTVVAIIFSFGILFLVSAAIVGLFNPNVSDMMFAVKGLRVGVFIFVYFFIGLAIGAHTDFVDYFFRIVALLVCLNILFGVLEFLFPYNSLFYNLIKWEFGDELDSIYTVRVCGLLVGPVQFALSCGMLFFFYLVKYLYVHCNKKYIILALLGFIGLLISKSRAVLFAVLFLVFVLLFWSKCLTNKMKMNAVLIFCVFVLLFIAFLCLFVSSDIISILLARYFDAFNPDSLAGSSFKAGRLDRWVEDVFPAIANMPWGGGTGFTQSFGEDANIAYHMKPILTESIYFDVFMELGWWAGGVFLLLVLCVIWVAVKNLRKSSDSITLICALCVLLFLIPGLTSPNMAAFPYTYFFAISLGILVVRSSMPSLQGLNNGKVERLP